MTCGAGLLFLRQDGLSGDVPPHLTQPCYVALGRALILGLYHPVPCYLNSDKLFLYLSDRYRNPEQDSNLGPKPLSLLEFKT